jgi:hypothetical protein
LKVTASAGPGTENPPAPPETFDQFAVLLQLPGDEATQNRCAKAEFKEKKHKSKEKTATDNFFKTLRI